MQERKLNSFANANADYDLKLALARDLERVYTSVLMEPVPPELRAFIERLERTLEQHARG